MRAYYSTAIPPSAVIFGVLWADAQSTPGHNDIIMCRDLLIANVARDTRDGDSGDARLRLIIAELTLSGSISLALTARNLGISSRTLQRRLHERGMSFWTMVDECRFRIAGALLRETDLSVQEIAARVGYSTAGAFARAFSRWAGQPPRTFRQAFGGQQGGQNIGAIWAELKTDKR